MLKCFIGLVAIIKGNSLTQRSVSPPANIPHGETLEELACIYRFLE
jgi:hypothetical protein